MVDVVAVIPAHNEQDTIGETLDALKNQTIPPAMVFVVADNCTDNTAQIARECGALVIVTHNNIAKKAGALNQALDSLLPHLFDDDLILVQDADSALDETFIQNAMPYAKSKKYGAVGGVFRGQRATNFVEHLQAREYDRYAFDVRNLGGRCLVVTGTAAVFRVGVMVEVSIARLLGELPTGDGHGGVYDTSVLTEDNELSFAVKTLGYELISPEGCYLTTELMPTWRDLWKQRLRWKRGAVENCVQYGVTRVTWPYWFRQFFTLLGLIVSMVYIATICYAMYDGWNWEPVWMAITLIFMAERAVTIKSRGLLAMLTALTMYELVLDYFLQLCHAKAFADVALKRERKW